MATIFPKKNIEKAPKVLAIRKHTLLLRAFFTNSSCWAVDGKTVRKMSVGMALKSNKMDTLSYKTVSANKATAQKEWVVVDAEGQVLGRMCTKIAKLLRGKYKPSFTPNVDCGDNVIVINADKVRLTGNKWNDRVYVRYTGFPGGQREMTPAQMLEKGADRLILKVVKGMLPKNRLGSKLLTNLRVFAGAEHNMQAQQPKQIDINTLKYARRIWILSMQ